MTRRGNHPGEKSQIKVQVVWRTGARTAAWDALWRQIIADLGAVLDQPPVNDEPEGSDLTPPPATSNEDEV